MHLPKCARACMRPAARAFAASEALGFANQTYDRTRPRAYRPRRTHRIDSGSMTDPVICVRTNGGINSTTLTARGNKGLVETKPWCVGATAGGRAAGAAGQTYRAQGSGLLLRNACRGGPRGRRSGGRRGGCKRRLRRRAGARVSQRLRRLRLTARPRRQPHPAAAPRQGRLIGSSAFHADLSPADRLRRRPTSYCNIYALNGTS